jgi:serine phosphatase RsbU (regulator of sigma subunit)/PAS domain-containing protein
MMQHAADYRSAERELAGIRARRDALQQSATLPGAELHQVLDAAFTELDGAIEAASALQAAALQAAAELQAATALRAGSALEAGSALAAPSAVNASDAERQIMGSAFQDAPVPMFLLERNGTIRRANRQAGNLLGAQPGYATGRLLTAFVDLRSRAAVQAKLAAVAQTGKAEQIQCSLLATASPAAILLAVEAMEPRDGPPLLIVAAIRPAAVADLPPAGDHATRAPGRLAPDGSVPDGRVPDGRVPDGRAADGRVSGGRAARGTIPASPAVPGSPAAGLVEAMTQRLDLVTAATRLLLDNAAFSESVTLQRCARLLAGELAAWVIVDLDRRQRLRRQVVIGPSESDSTGLVRQLAAVDPLPGTAPGQVHESGSSLLLAHAEDIGILGIGAAGVPLLMMIDATSLLCVPVTDGERSYGVLTLARQAGEQPFELADLGLVEELGQHLGLTIRVDRMFRRRTEIADSLQASLLPRELPIVPGIEFAAAYIAATEGLEVGGDFYDVYRTPGGWGISIGDVCGKGEEAAAVTAAARHAIRVLARWNPDPAEVLHQANEIMLAEEFDGRFVTACAAHLQWRDGGLHVVVGSAGHPGAVLIRPDGRVRMLTGGGMALGLFPEVVAATEELELSQGDLLFLFTDGITDARSPDMTYFEDRLSDELAALAGRPPAEIVNAMQTLVLEFSMNELRDDMTMLVLRVGDDPG